ncbi:DVU_1557 family redox protein [Syntrophobacter fumaroxidans]|uniref:DVU_1557 family redox protein n=1 Tax=Syntrophobacter fumaroxidans TaxID=119484 RepID=UPI0002DF32A9|nr:CLJU_RS11820 family redox protein [Syntrophobacter fumaroxidans]
MNAQAASPEGEKWWCGKCRVPLDMGKVNVSYLGSSFPVDLLKCPRCGLVFVPEELALGRMAEVERLLEDK